MIRLLIFCFVIVICDSCTESAIDPVADNYTLELDARLDSTLNGYYFLKLNPSSNSIQTIHRIGGRLLKNGTEPNPPELVNWESSHVWILGDTLGVVIHRRLTPSGVWLDNDTTYVTHFSGLSVPTINESSLSGTDGEINTVIAPISDMVGDTMTVMCKFQNINKTIKIILY